MGCPVTSIKEMEDGLRYRRQKMVIVILANANSDSDAVNFILNNFHEMDIISDDVDFYLPGYGINKYQRELNRMMDLEWANQRALEMYPDFHCDVEQRGLFERWIKKYRSESLSHCKIIDSPRLGEIIFNIAEFTDFVYEFTNRIGGYHYLGGSQMILLVPNEKGLPDYSNASVYDLDAIIGSRSGCSLDAFLHRTFNIIRGIDRGNDYPNHSRILNVLFRNNRRGNNTVNILREIDKLYFDATRLDMPNERYEYSIRGLIADMSRCLDWDVAYEKFYFISYSSQNAMKANSLKILLQRRGLHVWIAPDGIPQGREYPVVIPTALKLAKVFVLLLTPESARSQWVRRELAIAISNYETRIKVLLADGMTIAHIRGDIELEFLLDRVQVKYDYAEVVHSQETLDRFITE